MNKYYIMKSRMRESCTYGSVRDIWGNSYIYSIINRCIKDDLSIRDLRREIKSNSYERLINKPDKIDIIVPEKILLLQI